MKKSLSVLLSVAMMFSVFASFAFGQEAAQTTEAKYQQLVERGIFTGMPDGQAHLDADMTRAQFATVLLRLFELNENVAASNVYNDLDGAGWAAGAIGAATQAGLMQGRGDGVFDPSGSVTVQELAIVLTRAFQLQPSNETIPGIVDDWAKGQVAAAIKAGLITAKANYTAPALRGDLVDSSYTAHQTIAALTEPEVAFSATKATELQVKFSKAVDTSKVEFDVNYSGATITPASVQWSADNTTATIEFSSRLQQGAYNITVTGATANAVEGSVNIEDEKAARIEILGDTGAAVMGQGNEQNVIKFVNVHYQVFNQYNENVTKTSNVNFVSSLGAANADTQKGIVEIQVLNSSYLPFGSQFTINAHIPGTGVSLNKMMKIGEEAKAHTINVLGMYHPQDKKLNAGMSEAEYQNFALLLEVKDQYGNIMDDVERLKEQISGFTNNIALADLNRETNSSTLAFQNNLGENNDQVGVTLKKSTNANMPSMKGTVTATFHPIFGGAQATYSFDVNSASVADSIQLMVPSTTVAQGETVTIPFRALDREGNEVTDLDMLATGTDAVRLYGAAGPQDFKFEENAETGNAEIKFTARHTGQVYLSANTSSGKTSQISINVRDAKVPASVIGVTNTVKTAMLVGVKDPLGNIIRDAGATKIESDEFTIRDQYGNNLNIFGKTNGKDYNGDYVIEVKMSDRLANSGASISHQDSAGTINKSVTGVVYLAKDEYVIIEGGTLKTTADLEVSVLEVVKDANGYPVVPAQYKNVELTNNYGNTTDYTVNGKRNIALSIVNLQDISEYKVDEVKDPLYTTRRTAVTNDTQPPAWYAAAFPYRDLEVYGLSGGKKVALPAKNIYSITLTENGIDLKEPVNPADPYQIKVTEHTDANGPRLITGGNQTKKMPVTILVVGHEKTTTLTTEVTLTSVKPVETTIKVDSVVTLSSTSTIGDIMDEVEVRDQHNVEWDTSNKTGSIVISEVKNSAGMNLVTGQRYNLTSANLTEVIGGTDGNTFKVHYVTNNGKYASFVVQIEN